MEGARVKARYQELSREYGIPWRGRNYDRSDWEAGDVINRAVSAANSCLYGVCHAAILIAGYSAAIGFVHTGHPLAFVYDVADLYKMDLSVPVAFKVVAAGEENVATRVRHQLRDEFRRTGFMENVIPTIEHVLDAGTPGEAPPDELGGAHPELSAAEDAPWYHGIRMPDESSSSTANNHGAEMPHEAEASNHAEEPNADWLAAESASVLDPLGLNDPQAGRGTGW